MLLFLWNKSYNWNHNRNWRFESGNTEYYLSYCSTPTPRIARILHYEFRFISLSKVETAWTEVFGHKWCTIWHKRHHTKIWQIGVDMRFIKGLMAWNVCKIKVFTLKKSDRLKLPFSSLTSPDVVETGNSAS